MEKFNVEINEEAKQIVANKIKTLSFKKRLGLKLYLAFMRREYKKAGFVRNSIAFFNDVADCIFDNDQDPQYVRFCESCMRQIAC